MPIDEPNARSNASGSAWDWCDESEFEGNPPLFETIVWTGYSAGTGEYSAIAARWSLDKEHGPANKEKGLLFLEHVSVKRPYQPWSDFLTSPAKFISDKHRRIAQAVAREYFGMQKFKSRTRMHPQNKE